MSKLFSSAWVFAKHTRRVAEGADPVETPDSRSSSKAIGKILNGGAFQVKSYRAVAVRELASGIRNEGFRNQIQAATDNAIKSELSRTPH